MNHIVGMKFGRLTIMNTYLKNTGNRSTRFVSALCDCGNTKEVIYGNLKNNITKSCGCYLSETVRERRTTHGLLKHPLYLKWHHMKQRCYLKTWARYSDWGGRGIVVCDEWKNDFMAFYNWAMNNGYENGLQIDRINNDGNYEPSNCRFVTAKENANNRRKKIQQHKTI